MRRVAISLQYLGLPFEHQSLSVFRTFDQFRQINPVVKAPSLVCDDGEVLMDSSLILEYAESLAGRSLMPTDRAARQHALRMIGLSLAACEKSAQIVYEHNLRPAEKVHQPWLDRVTSQLLAAYEGLEAGLIKRSMSVSDTSIDQAAISTAVAWHFTRQMLPDVLHATRYPTLHTLSEQAEQLAAFRKAPYGDGTYPVNAG